MDTEKKLCLIIRPTGEGDPELQRRSDLLLRYLVIPALEECGYSPVKTEPGFITSQAIQQGLEEPLVVADLTGLKPEVFYALALRHVARKPLIQISRKGEKLPVDFAEMKTIPVDHTDLESVYEAKTEIIRQIRATEGKKPEELGSPIPLINHSQYLRLHGDRGNSCQQETLAAFGDFRRDISTRLAAIERRLADSPGPAAPDLADRHLMQVIRQGSQAEMNAVFSEIGRIEDLVTPLPKVVGSDDPNCREFARLAEVQARLAVLRERGEILRATPVLADLRNTPK